MRVGIAAHDFSAREFIEIAQLADESGFDAIWIGEHVLVPDNFASTHPSQLGEDPMIHARAALNDRTTLLDPFVALAAAAATTERLKVATGVIILPLYSPLVVARAAATLHDVSGGRFVLGIGSGWLQEEFAALGVSFVDRLSRYKEAIEILKLSWQGGRFSFEGRYHSFTNVQTTPAAVRVPLIFGGNTEVALKRAVRLGDGWMSSATPTFEEAAVLAAKIRAELQQRAAHGEFRTYFRTTARTAVELRRYEDEGIEDVVLPYEVIRQIPRRDRPSRIRDLANDLGLEGAPPAP